MPTANQCKHFVEAVLNGDDKDSVAAIRNRFARLYRDWFPPDVGDEHYVQVMLDAWRVPHVWWCRDAVQQENPQTYFEWRVAVLRDKLRFIWLAERDAARFRVKRLAAETVEYFRDEERIEPWKERQFAVCDWLEKWLTARKGSR